MSSLPEVSSDAQFATKRGGGESGKDQAELDERELQETADGADVDAWKEAVERGA